MAEYKDFLLLQRFPLFDDQATSYRLEIAGIPMPSFVQLMLKQSINEHHYFEITLDIQAIEAYGVEIPEASKDWVGKK